MTCKTNPQAVLRPWGSETINIGATLSRVWIQLLNWQGRASARHHAEALSDQQLRDIGLTRAQLLGAPS